MFVAASTSDPSVLDRLSRWAEVAWPDGSYERAHEWDLWSDGREHQLPSVLDDCVVVVDGVVWRDRELWSRRLADRLAGELSNSWPLENVWDGSFGVAVLRPGEATVALDPGGLRRMYFAHATSGGTLVVSSLQLPCALATSKEPDLAGVAQMLGLGYCIGDRTMFESCRSVWPGESLQISRAGHSAQTGVELAVDPTRAASAGLTWAEAADRLEPVLRTSAARAYDSFSSVAIALSSGTDSRLALGSLLPDRVPGKAFSYGDPREGDVRIARRIASLSGMPHETVDLRGHLFPGEQPARQDALRCEATWHPAWIEVNRALQSSGCTALLLGDVTDSLQVRGEALWNRRDRVRRQLERALRPSRPEELPAHYSSPAAWWDNWVTQATSRAVNGAINFRLDVDTSEVAQAVAADATATWNIAHLGEYVTALELEDSLQIPIARQQAGSQVNAIGGGAVGHALFATRSCVRAGRNVGLDLRKDRRLILELCRRLLPKGLGRLPTATIPLVPTTSPLILQNGVWASRFAADWVMRHLNTLLNGQLKRERIAKTLELPAEYREAGEDFFLGYCWARSRIFNVAILNSEFRSMQAGTSIPMVPISHYSAVRIDSMLAYLNS